MFLILRSVFIHIFLFHFFHIHKQSSDSGMIIFLNFVCLQSQFCLTMSEHSFSVNTGWICLDINSLFFLVYLRLRRLNVPFVSLGRLWKRVILSLQILQVLNSLYPVWKIWKVILYVLSKCDQQVTFSSLFKFYNVC